MLIPNPYPSYPLYLPEYLDENPYDFFGFKVSRDVKTMYPFENLIFRAPVVVRNIPIDGNQFNHYVLLTNNKKQKNCILTDENRKEIREQMKANLRKLNSGSNADSISITFSGQDCPKSSGEKVVEEYRDKIRNAVNATEGNKRVEFNTSNPDEFEPLSNGSVRKGWELVKKYNKTDSNITKIKVYLNNREYKEIPYQGTITDEYYKILFTSSLIFYDNFCLFTLFSSLMLN
jgi:hypothetical protein